MNHNYSLATLQAVLDRRIDRKVCATPPSVLWLSGVILLFSLSGCGSDVPVAIDNERIRGLKTVVVEDTENSELRRYPSVLQPAELTTLSFEVAGRLANVDLRIGQQVTQDQILLTIDPETLQLQVENAEAALRQARATARNADSNLKRQKDLATKGVVSQASLEQAQTDAATTQSQVSQASKQLEIARENLSKAAVKAPFNATVHTVEVDSFANVSAGVPVVSLYRTDGFDVSFSVSYDVSNKLTVGKQLMIRLADAPEIVLPGQIKELGARADTVSSFPVVAALTATAPGLKAGMAVEVNLEVDVSTDDGLLVPISVFALKGKMRTVLESTGNEKIPHRGGLVYVFDEASSSIHARKVTVAGIRENRLIVIDGLQVGERVASAGVAFLRDGQRVNLLPSQKQ